MNRPLRVGLTGSIGMGKSTTAAMFRDLGVPVWDADVAVARAYATGGAAVAAVGALCPEAVVDGGVDRGRLKAWIAAHPEALARLEAAVHPVVRADREEFARAAAARGDSVIVFDIPLLFETGAEAEMDAVIVVSVPAPVQRARVLARPGMTEDVLETLLARQMPDADKRARADYVIDASTFEGARAAVAQTLDSLRRTHA